MRADGTRVRDLTSMMQALPCIMPHRYGAQVWAGGMIDEDIVKAYIRRKRRVGRRVTRMSVLAAADYRTALENPKVNYFIRNRRIYRRNMGNPETLETRLDGLDAVAAGALPVEMGEAVL